MIIPQHIISKANELYPEIQGEAPTPFGSLIIDENEGYRHAYIAGRMKQEDWIDVTQRQPEQYQEVIFIVDSTDPSYNNRRMGGRYQRAQRGYYEFTTPGNAWGGKYWLPIPRLPLHLSFNTKTDQTHE